MGLSIILSEVFEFDILLDLLVGEEVIELDLWVDFQTLGFDHSLLLRANLVEIVEFINAKLFSLLIGTSFQWLQRLIFLVLEMLFQLSENLVGQILLAFRPMEKFLFEPAQPVEFVSRIQTQLSTQLLTVLNRFEQVLQHLHLSPHLLNGHQLPVLKHLMESVLLNLGPLQLTDPLGRIREGNPHFEEALVEYIVLLISDIEAEFFPKLLVQFLDEFVALGVRNEDPETELVQVRSLSSGLEILDTNQDQNQDQLIPVSLNQLHSSIHSINLALIPDNFDCFFEDGEKTRVQGLPEEGVKIAVSERLLDVHLQQERIQEVEEGKDALHVSLFVAQQPAVVEIVYESLSLGTVVFEFSGEFDQILAEVQPHLWVIYVLLDLAVSIKKLLF